MINQEQYTNRVFAIFSVTESHLIDFDQVKETSIDTLMKSVDGNKTFVKWDGPDMPSSVQALQTKEGPYTHQEMLSIINTPEWKDFEASIKGKP